MSAFRDTTEKELAAEILGRDSRFMLRFGYADEWDYREPVFSEALEQALSDYFDDAITRYPQLLEPRIPIVGQDAGQIVTVYTPDVQPLSLYRNNIWEISEEWNPLFEQEGLWAVVRYANRPNAWSKNQNASDSWPETPEWGTFDFAIYGCNIPIVKSNLIPGSVMSRRDEILKQRAQMKLNRYERFDFDRIQLRVDHDRLDILYFSRIGDQPQLETLAYDGAANCYGQFNLCVFAFEWNAMVAMWQEGTTRIEFSVRDGFLIAQTVQDVTRFKLLSADLVTWAEENIAPVKIPTLELCKSDKAWLGKVVQKTIKRWDNSNNFLTWGWTTTVGDKQIVATTDGSNIHFIEGSFPERRFVQFPKSAAFDPTNTKVDAYSQLIEQFLNDRHTHWSFSFHTKDLVKALKRVKKTKTIAFKLFTDDRPDTIELSTETTNYRLGVTGLRVDAADFAQMSASTLLNALSGMGDTTHVSKGDRVWALRSGNRCAILSEIAEG